MDNTWRWSNTIIIHTHEAKDEVFSGSLSRRISLMHKHQWEGTQNSTSLKYMNTWYTCACSTTYWHFLPTIAHVCKCSTLPFVPILYSMCIWIVPLGQHWTLLYKEARMATTLMSNLHLSHLRLIHTIPMLTASWIQRSNSTTAIFTLNPKIQKHSVYFETKALST